MTKKYRKKPIIVEAEQFFPGVNPLPKGVHVARGIPGSPAHGFLKTLEGDFIVTPGDWIITGIKGEKYPCKPDVFAATYEPVEDES